MASNVTLPMLQAMQREGKKIVALVAWDTQIATIADRVGVEMVVIGDSVGVNLWGYDSPVKVTLDDILVVTKAVRRGVKRALVCCDMPFGPFQEGLDSALKAAVRIVKEAGADLIKVDGAVDFPNIARAIVRAGIPIMGLLEITPQAALQYGIPNGAQLAADAPVPPAMVARFVEQAKIFQEAGVSLIDFTNSGPIVGAAVVEAVSIPVIGGFGGGSWLDGRVRIGLSAIGYGASNIGKDGNYANVAKITLDAFTALSADIRAGRQIKY